MKKGIIKSALAIAMAGVISFGLIGCGAKAEGDKFDEIKEKGKIVVGLNAGYAPFEFHMMENGEDKIVGFDISIAEEIAKDLGVELEIKDMKFDSLLSALTTDKIDLIISGMTPTEERKKSVDFSDIYYVAGQAMLVRAEDAQKYNTFEALKGQKVGAQLGSIQADIVAENIEDADIQLLNDVNDLILSLKSKKIEALVVEEVVADMAVENNPELAKSDYKIDFSDEGVAIAVKKNSPKLLEEVNSTIKKLQDEGLIDQFMKDANKLAATLN